MSVSLTWREPADESALRQASQVLAAGGIVACPTETFYALAVDAFQEGPLNKLMRIKGRPWDKALLVLVADYDMVKLVAQDISPLAKHLMAEFWPGPLTLILPARTGLPLPLTGGSGTIGVRQSGHPLAQRLPMIYGRPVTGTSANLSGRDPLLSSTQVQQELGDAVDLILEDGPCAGGLPSTILSVVHDPPRLIRTGATSLAEMERHIGKILR